MEDLWVRIVEFFTSERVVSLVKVGVLVIAGLLVARVAANGMARLLRRHMGTQHALLARRLTWYTVLALTAVMALRELGFDLSVLLGAAGVLSVAIGFASQTSASNLISGLFLIGERPFVIGDVIRIGGTTGEVLSIDLMSVKLRTFDNLFVRVPNETLVKSEITNLTHFPLRRLDLVIGVSYSAEVGKVRDVLLAVAERNPQCLEEPKPILMFTGFGDSAQQLQLSLWTTRESFLQLRTSIHEEVKAAFDAAGIEIPFPQRTVHIDGALRAGGNVPEANAV